MSRKIMAALVGQPNCGKSTVFNMLTGARQHVANYPGVTVEKKTGAYVHAGRHVELVDLPGTYGLTSYSLEERVARDFLIHDRPSAAVNVIDASNLERHLSLTLQLLELEIPVAIWLNMMDVAESRGISIDEAELSRRLGVPVASGVGKKGVGKARLREAVEQVASEPSWDERAYRLDYGELEPHLASLEHLLAEGGLLSCPRRWLAVKLMEGDEEATRLAEDEFHDPAGLMRLVEERRTAFQREVGQPPQLWTSIRRSRLAASLAAACQTRAERSRVSFSDKADALVCHRVLGPILLVGILFALYWLSIVQGYEVTKITWPLLAGAKNLLADWLPPGGFIEDPLLRSLGLWFADSVNALLNYVPIFLILFALVAVLEDSGYMPRMAFILDRIFRRFGLHGQSTLPLTLAGFYVGGCVVPGVMACKAIPDEKSRLATILVAPLMNCLAKTPLYVLLVSAFFPEARGQAMFFISTVTVFMALPIARLLSETALRGKEEAPFIMEMPPYHLPTISGVLRRSIERTALFAKKIVTTVAAVAVVVFVLLQFPGLSKERLAEYRGRADAAIAAFRSSAKDARFAAALEGDGVTRLLHFEEDYKAARSGVTDQEKAKAIDEEFADRSEPFFKILKPRGDNDAKQVAAAWKTLSAERLTIVSAMKKERLNMSFLGMLGRALEPVTALAGFDWRVNASLLSAFAAKESAVATLGAIYMRQSEDGEAASLEESMRAGAPNFTPLHALALMLFMALYPPCIATAMVIKVQSGDAKWMFLAMAYPTLLGFLAASLVFTGGSLLGLTGLQAMWSFYGLCAALTLATALIPNAQERRARAARLQNVPELAVAADHAHETL